jgi:hypothetical protein
MTGGALGADDVPRALAAIEAGVWKPPTGDEVYLRVFGDRPEQPEFYGRTMLVNRTPPGSGAASPSCTGARRPTPAQVSTRPGRS